ncbi:Modification methylase DpnIIA [Methanosarcinaceae archaeon Ag5]|uniref:site-specific DNA-methyltransferase (adenine-specific) n=1 Tax=Methanolapillus africanus TaxID=3028297 RepID=A0AAE4SFV3_9EURY|nr:Modification methylase DpnIIA [Methanosarcinaceae archaeon Ag5]
MQKTIKTALRYPGGKSRALKQILPMFPKEFSEYREPFIGGGSVFISQIQQNSNRKYWINDFNYDLYCFWDQVQKNCDEMVQDLKDIKSRTRSGKKLYEKLKVKEEDDIYQNAVRFFILNRITFSGLAECGGYSNESFEKRFTESSIERLRPLSDLLKDVTITNMDYEKVMTNCHKDTFIFLDPPYLNVKESRLYGVKGNLHRDFDHERFADTVEKCGNKCKWLITCDDSPEIRELFGFAEIKEWELQYGVNNRKESKQAKKGKEVFISNYKING